MKLSLLAYPLARFLSPSRRAEVVCSEGAQPVICGATDVSGCVKEEFVGCPVFCDNTASPLNTYTCGSSNFTESEVDCINGACSESRFKDSTVKCRRVGNNRGHTCRESLFNRTAVDCSGESSCRNSFFYASAVSNCGQDDSSFKKCAYSSFFSCSCCDGERCPDDGTPSCTEDPVSFCSTLLLGQTCKAWGNPACADVTLPSNVEPPTALSTPAPAPLPTTVPVQTPAPVNPPTVAPTPSPTAKPTASPTPAPVQSPTSAPVSSPTIASVDTGSTPTPDNGTVTTNEETPVIIPVSELDLSSLEIEEQPLNGKATVNEDNTITYTPNAGFVGQDRFEYKSCNANGECKTVEVRVYVTVAATSHSHGKGYALCGMFGLVLVNLFSCM